MFLNKDYKEMLHALNDAGVEYLIVGAYALAVHGNMRSTGDIDIWVRPTPENDRKSGEHLRRSGPQGVVLNPLISAILMSSIKLE
jgi:hypothetical protein